MVYRVLLADDSLTIQKLVEMALSDSDFNLLAVSDGQQAIDVLTDFRPDIILADTIMPFKDGYEVCQYVKQDPQFRHTPVILLTGRFQPYDKDRAESVSVDATVSKPFSQNQLVSEMRQLLEARPPAPAPPPPPPAAAAPMPMLHQVGDDEDEEYDETATIQVSSEDLRAQLMSARARDSQSPQMPAPPPPPIPGSAAQQEDFPAEEENYMELATEDLEEVEEEADDAVEEPPSGLRFPEDDLDEMDESGEAELDLAGEDLVDLEQERQEEDSDAFQLIEDEGDDLPSSLTLEDTDEIESFVTKPKPVKGADTQPISSAIADEDTQPLELRLRQEPDDEEFQLDLEEEARADEDDSEPELMSLSDVSLESDDDETVTAFEDPPVSDFYELPEPIQEFEDEDDENDTTFELEAPIENEEPLPEEEPEELVSAGVGVGEPEHAAIEESDEDLDPLDLDEAMDDSGGSMEALIVDHPDTEFTLDDQEDPLVVELEDEDEEAKTRPTSPNDEAIAETDTLPTSKRSIRGLRQQLASTQAAEEAAAAESQAEEEEPHQELDFTSEPELEFESEPDIEFDAEPEEEIHLDEELEEVSEPEPVVVKAAPAPILVTPEAMVGEDAPIAAAFGRGPIVLSDSQLTELADMVSARIIKSLGNDQVREVVWQVIPELAEAMIKKRIYQLEQSVQDS